MIFKIALAFISLFVIVLSLSAPAWRGRVRGLAAGWARREKIRRGELDA